MEYRSRYGFAWAAIVLLLATGCQRVTPVEEISVASSGVKVVDSPALAELASQWPGWRGPDNSGVAQDNASTPTTWNERTATWITEVPGRGHSSPVIVNDLVLLASADRDKQQQLLLAYDRSSGDLRWSAIVHDGSFPSPRDVHRKATNANSTVACDGERIYCVFLNGGKIIASAYDLEGAPLWTREAGSFASKFGYAPSPILYRSLVLIAADNHGGGYLVAMDGATGKIAWRTKRPAVATFSSAVVASVGGKDQLLISGARMVASYDPLTGDKNWSKECVSESTCGTIVTDGERVFASGGYPERETVGLSTDGKLVWSNRTQVYEPSLLCVNGLVFAVTDDGIAKCWDSESGERKWQKRLGGSFSASPIAINGLIYVPDLSGKTFVFRASGDGYEEVAVNRLGDDSYASLATSDGQIFIRAGFGRGDERKEKLVCIPAETSE